jgi:hypothetical protein
MGNVPIISSAIWLLAELPVHKNNTRGLPIFYPQQPGAGFGPQPLLKSEHPPLEKIKKLPKIWIVLSPLQLGHFTLNPFSFSEMLAFISNVFSQS